MQLIFNLFYFAFSACQTINLFWSKFHIHHDENKEKQTLSHDKYHPQQLKLGKVYTFEVRGYNSKDYHSSEWMDDALQ